MQEELLDETLQKMAADGSAEAEEILIRRYGRVIRRIARPFFLTGGDGEDLFQEGMLGLLNAIRSFDPAVGISFRSYSELCIRRRLISAIRSAAGKRTVSLDECLSLESSLFDEDPSQNRNQRGPEDLVIDREEARKTLDGFLHLLSEFEKKVLRCFLQGMSYREIAEITGKPDKSVDNAVQRIRRKIAALQQDSGDNSFG